MYMRIMHVCVNEHNCACVYGCACIWKVYECEHMCVHVCAHMGSVSDCVCMFIWVDRM